MHACVHGKTRMFDLSPQCLDKTVQIIPNTSTYRSECIYTRRPWRKERQSKKTILQNMLTRQYIQEKPSPENLPIERDACLQV